MTNWRTSIYFSVQETRSSAYANMYRQGGSGEKAEEEGRMQREVDGKVDGGGGGGGGGGLPGFGGVGGATNEE